jgi:bifunctional non-homologous end joining protein LigD
MSRQLETYRRKRNFSRSPEPEGGGEPTKPGFRFVIQKHAARRLHYDLRLELDGVFKSWAVTEGPSLMPSEKRLAVEVEDHPLDYGNFEGRIAKGEYGGGTVLVWDRGEWSPIGDPHAGLAKGHLEFDLLGEKLGGRWHLVRMRRKAKEKQANWLLIKADDAAARVAGTPEITEEMPRSVVSNRTLEMIAREPDPEPAGKSQPAEPLAVPAGPRVRIDPASLAGATPAPLPTFIEPCLATLTHAPPTGDKWLHEIKFDGYRLQARISRGRISLRTRNGLDWTEKFAGAPFVGGLRRLALSTGIIDAEVVSETAGVSDFAQLQADLAQGKADRLVLYAFDLLHLDGHDLRGVALAQRKQALEQLIGTDAALRYSAHIGEGGEILLRHACRLGLEGIVSKLREGRYRSGRGGDWLKSKCALGQEFLIIGFVPSSTSKRSVGALALAYHRDGALVYAGRVGSGIAERDGRELFDKLEPLRVEAPSFAQAPPADPGRPIRWVEPRLLAQVEFRGWTATALIRQGVFKGLRGERQEGDLLREDQAEPALPALKILPQFTHPDRLLWPESGVTKQGLAEFYMEIWPWIGPHIAGRPLSLLRAPHGVGGPSFFQKHAFAGLSDAVQRVPEGDGEPLLAIRDCDGLMALVQASVVEIHPWPSTVKAIEKPDRLIFDLDPGEGTGWEALCAAALDLKVNLREAGLESFVKTSGSKGLHVVVPLAPVAGFDEVKAYAQRFAVELAKRKPDRYVASAVLALRPGRIYIDYLRNARTATTIAPYSTRARPQASVAAPIGWDELGPDMSADRFRITNLLHRLDRLAQDPWAAMTGLAQTLPRRQR